MVPLPSPCFTSSFILKQLSRRLYTCRTGSACLLLATVFARCVRIPVSLRGSESGSEFFFFVLDGRAFSNATEPTFGSVPILSRGAISIDSARDAAVREPNIAKLLGVHIVEPIIVGIRPFDSDYLL